MRFFYGVHKRRYGKVPNPMLDMYLCLQCICCNSGVWRECVYGVNLVKLLLYHDGTPGRRDKPLLIPPTGIIMLPQTNILLL